MFNKSANVINYIGLASFHTHFACFLLIALLLSANMEMYVSRYLLRFSESANRFFFAYLHSVNGNERYYGKDLEMVRQKG